MAFDSRICFCFGYTFKKINKLHYVWALILAILLAANPVSLYQITSYYIDGQMNSLMITLLALFSLIFTTDDKKELNNYKLLLVVSGILLINIKLVGLIYAAIFLAAYIGFIIVRKNLIFRQIIFLTLLIAIGGVGLFGFSSFVTNQIYNGNILYPIFGKNTYDFKSENLPNNFRTKNNLEVALYTPFLESDNTRGEKDIGNFKIPLTITGVEYKAFAGSNAKKGGFGPLFGGTLILSGLILVWFLFIQYRTKRTLNDDENSEKNKLYKQNWTSFYTLLFTLAIICFSVVLNSASTYARFVPQYWLLVIFVIGFAFISKFKTLKAIAFVMSCLLLFNIFFVTKANLDYQVATTDKLKAKLSEVKSKTSKEKPLIIDFNNATATRQRLKDFGIYYQDSKTLTCKSKTQYYFPDNESDVCLIK